MNAAVLGALGAGLVASLAHADIVTTATPRTTALELKLGGYKPRIDQDAALGGRKPYEETFGAGAMLLFEVEGDRLLWQDIGSLGVGLSLGYAEKYGAARVVDSETGASERTALKVVPIRLLGTYRFDYAALAWNIPLVPYVKAGLVYVPWWIEKGGRVEFTEGLRGAGGQWGYQGTVGLSLLLDFFEPRLAKDFDSDLGVNHSYLFAEYVHADVNDFGASGALDLSGRYWMFGLTLEY